MVDEPDMTIVTQKKNSESLKSITKFLRVWGRLSPLCKTKFHHGYFGL